LCMEICDAESCWFVQYRPARIFWEDEIMSIIEVKRDREWFAEKLPIARSFWDDVLYYKSHMPKLLRLIEGKKHKRSPAGKTVTIGDEGVPPERARCLIDFDETDASPGLDAPVPSCLIDF
jgi:hypothetical protein